jgi:hypothetical protein
MNNVKIFEEVIDAHVDEVINVLVQHVKVMLNRKQRVCGRFLVCSNIELHLHAKLTNHVYCTVTEIDKDYNHAYLNNMHKRLRARWSCSAIDIFHNDVKRG